jgi:hypothetical protein
MSYRFKGPKVIIEGDINKIVAQTLPIAPENGQFVIDSADNKLKVWNATRWIILGDAVNQVFNNSINGFTATETQSAIEEAKTSAIAKARFTIVTVFNGTIGNNNWLGYNELVPGNQVPIRIPIGCKVKEISFAYKNTLLSSDYIDGKFKLFKNGFTNPTHVIHTEQFTDQLGGKNVVGLNLVLVGGDFIVGKWIDEGNNPSDMAIVYFFEVT